MWTVGFQSLLGLLCLPLVIAIPTASSPWDSALHPPKSSSNSSLPVVDLGYELHRAAYFNDSAGFYNFSNIRYGAPPVRFAEPEPPATNRDEVQTGSVGKICPQARPPWILLGYQFAVSYSLGLPFNLSAAAGDSGNSATGSSVPTFDPRTDEDCLFLDVIVPQKIFGKGHQGRGAPVLVWLYGGGYTSGEKSSDNAGSPIGLIKRGNDSFIYVSLNYRLGAFGWSAGPTVQADGVANAGLYDQRLALQWIQEKIHLFGGDPDRVTVFGESAGGGSIMHQITAYGGLKDKAPFQQAIPQSPGWGPIKSNYITETNFQNFLALLNVSTIEEARQLPSEAVIAANYIQVAASPYGSFTYGPAVDGNFVPALPGELLARGQFDKSVRVMVGHNANEGLLFTPPDLTNETVYNEQVQQSLPQISQPALDYITQTLYPPVFDGSYGYTDEIQRGALTTGELAFTCNERYLTGAYDESIYSYEFSVFPALHGQDVDYTYYNNEGATGNVYDGVQDATVAVALQNIIASFAVTGTPDGGPGVPEFPLYGPEENVLNLNTSGITVGKDTISAERCAWWQKALYV